MSHAQCDISTSTCLVRCAHLSLRSLPNNLDTNTNDHTPFTLQVGMKLRFSCAQLLAPHGPCCPLDPSAAR